MTADPNPAPDVLDVAALRELLTAATPAGDWYWTPYGERGKTLARPGPLLGSGMFGESRGHEHNILKTTDDWPPTEADAALIAALVNAAPALLTAAEERDALAERLSAVERALMQGGQTPAIRAREAIRALTAAVGGDS